MSQKPAGRIVDSQHGLFLFTEDAIFKFDPDSNSFVEVEVKEKDGATVRTFTGITKDPK